MLEFIVNVIGLAAAIFIGTAAIDWWRNQKK